MLYYTYIHTCMQIDIILLKYLLLGGMIMGNFFTFYFLIFSTTYSDNISSYVRKKSNLFFCGSLLKSECQIYLHEAYECNPEKLIPEVASADVNICVISCCTNFTISMSLLFLFYYLIKYLN